MADGAVLFEAKCAACHAGGGNVVARGKTLDRAALTANNVDIEAIVTMGKNQMPGFGEACARRVMEEHVRRKVRREEQQQSPPSP